MLNLTTEEIVQATNGQLIKDYNKKNFFKISTDSRIIKPNSLFIALKGDNFDGHDFINMAIKGGAIGLIISKSVDLHTIEKNNLCVIHVNDTLIALQDLARFYRRKMDIPIIAITGSNGKTTTKEMIAAVCSQRLETLKTIGNKNNLIGVPLTLLNILPKHQIGVLEMGMNNKGEIKKLTEISNPNYGIITNINMSHIQFFKSVDEIAEAKAEMLEAMDHKAMSILNIDDDYFSKLKSYVNGPLTTIGIKNKAEIMAENIKCEGGKSYFTLKTSEGEIPICLSLPGIFNIYNALYAAATGKILNYDLTTIKMGLEKIKKISMRMDIISLNNHINIINDTYNANPASMKEAIKGLKEINPQARHIVIIGDMLELGSWTEKAHRDLGNCIAQSNIDYLFTLGEATQLSAQEAIQQGMDKRHIIICNNHKDIALRLIEIAQEGDWLLVKGSRRTAMEKVIQELKYILIEKSKI